MRAEGLGRESLERKAQKRLTVQIQKLIGNLLNKIQVNKSGKEQHVAFIMIITIIIIVSPPTLNLFAFGWGRTVIAT